MKTVINIEDFKGRDVSGRLLDVRTDLEYSQSYHPEARLIPLDQLDVKIQDAGFSKDEPLYIMCQSGKRAERAADQLGVLGYQHCCVIEGGMNAWAAAGHQCLKKEAAPKLSLQRQILLIAGLLTAIGSLLALVWAPLFVILPLCIGLGLSFAGATGFCGLGLLLAKMPWNKSSCSCKH